VIKSFKDKETAKVFSGKISRKYPADIQRRTLNKLRIIHTALDINDLRAPPSNRLEILHGNRKGQYSIRVNNQWRICFRWEAGDAYEVQIVDYH